MSVTKRLLNSLLCVTVFSLVSCSPPAAELDAPDMETPEAEAPIPVKVVLVTMFEVGADEGDAPGEFQTWNERRNFTEVFPFPAFHDLYYEEDTGLLAMVTGMGTARAASSVMMLGMDPRFDLSKAYWIVAGIAGFDPADASIGSAAWATWLVDGDLAHEIDPREMPEDWPYGYLPLFSSGPFDPDRPESVGEVYQLNPALADWAYELTKDIELPDLPGLAEVRERYTEHPNGARPPFVLKGDNLAGMTFWHGEILNDWANEWTSYWTDGEGNFVSSAMEDTGMMQAVTWLDDAGRADRDRVMVLRTASNYTMPPPGVTAAENLLSEGEEYAGMEASLESAYLVASTVIDALIEGWDTHGETIPE